MYQLRNPNEVVNTCDTSQCAKPHSNKVYPYLDLAQYYPSLPTLQRQSPTPRIPAAQTGTSRRGSETLDRDSYHISSLKYINTHFG